MRGSRRTAADQPAVRDPRRRGRRDDSHRANRARLREGGQRDAEDAAATRARRAAATAARSARTCCRSLFAPDCSCRRARRRCSRRTFRRRTRRSTELNRFATPAQQRLIFEEAFLFQTGVAARRQTLAAERKTVVPQVDDRIRESARRVLPFKLTPGQKASLKEIVDDLQQPQPMNRLLQGDVGAGKTIVALLAALVAMENGLQVAFMAPTEILAEQHFLNVSRLLQSSRFRTGAPDRQCDRRGARAKTLADVAGGNDSSGDRHARARRRRRPSSSSSGSSSSTSSTASACCSARASGRRPCIRTCS